MGSPKSSFRLKQMSLYFKSVNDGNKRMIIMAVAIFVGILTLYGITSLFSSKEEYILAADDGVSDRLYSLTWNIAAINNNPFEYWVTNDDPAYNELMKSVSSRIVAPESEDNILVSDIFTFEMFNELAQKMKEAGFTGVDETALRYQHDLSKRSIYSGFLTDPLLGKKRLISMTDRVTNTIQTANGDVATRPTVINCYPENDLGSIGQWWPKWIKFMFHKQFSVISNKNGNEGETIVKQVTSMLSPIKKSKYPDITVEEEKISIPLQVTCAAIFDAILVDMMNKLAPKKWQPLRQDLCNNLNRNKLSRTAQILESSYSRTDIMFLQEVAVSFKQKVSTRPLGKSLFDVYGPAVFDADRDQNSFILLQKGKFMDVVEVTSGAMEQLQAFSQTNKKEVPVSIGDLIVLTTTHKKTGTKYILASFHGDTNGLATIPVVDAVRQFAIDKYADHKLLFGMDANTYSKPEADQQGVENFAKHYSAMGLNTCWGKIPDPINFTTFHARTHLQSQLNKAIALEDKEKKGDKNPKDFIMFDDKDFVLLHTSKDNTGARNYIENMVFPTLDFPSDHGITSTVLLDRPHVGLEPTNLRKGGD